MTTPNDIETVAGLKAIREEKLAKRAEAQTQIDVLTIERGDLLLADKMELLGPVDRQIASARLVVEQADLIVARIDERMPITQRKEELAVLAQMGSEAATAVDAANRFALGEARDLIARLVSGLTAEAAAGALLWNYFQRLDMASVTADERGALPRPRFEYRAFLPSLPANSSMLMSQAAAVPAMVPWDASDTRPAPFGEALRPSRAWESSAITAAGLAVIEAPPKPAEARRYEPEPQSNIGYVGIPPDRLSHRLARPWSPAA